MRLPTVLTLALLGRGVTAQTAQLPADLSDEAALREFRDQWFEIVKRVPREGLNPCPVSCSGEGTWNDTSVWDQYPDAASMATCDKPVLFTMMVDTDLPPAALRACTAPPTNSSLPAAGADQGSNETCVPALQAQQSSPIRFLSTASSAGASADSATIASAIRHVSSFVGRTSPSCNNNPIGFAQAGKAVVGLYVGAQVHRQGIPSQVIDRVLGLFSDSSPPAASFLVELCDPNAAYGADYMVGIAVNTGGDVHQVQQSVRQWTKGSCLAGASGVRVLGNNLTFLAPAPETTIPARRARRLSRREEYCTNSKSVVAGNTCLSIAEKRCTISIEKFYEYNLALKDACIKGTIQVGQKFCCNPGAVPPPDPVVPAPVPYCTNWKTVIKGHTCAHMADKRCTVSLSTFTSRNPQLNCASSGPVEGQTFCCNEGRVPPANECTNVKTVVEGNTCLNIAEKRCTISIAKFVEYNPHIDCGSVKVGQRICCNEGRVPPPGPPPKADGTCTTGVVANGDSCATLASKCGIGGDYIAVFNPQSGFCAGLKGGQTFCCGRGTLPDLRPKKNADGSCFVYTVKAEDSCSGIAVRHQLADEDLFTFNTNTWGWKGCGIYDLWPDTRICLSSGTPPMPAPIPNAVCGPTVPNTKRPTDGTALAKLNPCPLNVCCNHWGQCGLSQDFCAVTKSPTGAPGTTMCVSNCGTGIIKSNPPPSSQIRIAYFEAWNDNRPCLRLRVDRINTSKYTHIHFAFADVTPGTFQVDISKVQQQFNIFKTMTGVKKIISFGGWAFSAEAPTYQILRDAVKSANRDRFRSNLLKFVEDHNLDGIDLDWEYPGAPDIPGIPAADPLEGWNYATLLGSLKSGLPSHKTVSFAAPASYWYLRAFPIELIAQHVDYVVYMTYDFHGQWDVGNKWSMEGCIGGNCLRSHVNITQTNSALSMITKAGMPSRKVIVGVTSYGRSFRMTQAGCTGPMCTFTGTNKISNASPGRCTGTGGYIADAEIQEIIRTNPSARTWTQDQTDYLVYNNTDWVAYMSPANKASRESYYQSQAMGGSTDWAVDLQSFDGDSDAPNSANAVYIGPLVYDQKKVQCQPPCNLVLPPVRLASDTVISIPPYTTSLEVGSSVGTSFVVTTTTITIIVAPITTREIQQSNVEVKAGQTGGFIPTPSVPVPRPTYTVTNGNGVATARTLTLPPWPAITNGPPSRWSTNLPGPWVDSPSSPGAGGGGSSGGPFTIITAVVATAPTTRVVSWSTPPSSVVTCPPSTFALQNPATTLTLSQCTGRATIGWACPPATTVTFAGASTATLTARCTPFVTVGSWGTRPAPTGAPVPTKGPIVLPCYDGMKRYYIKEQDAYITLGQCPPSHVTTLDPNCGAPTTTVRIEANPTKSFALGCTLFTGTGTRPPPGSALPTHTTWDGELEWEDSEEGDDDNDNSDGKSTCKLWFFNICLRLGGWRWKFPSGIYPVGPPPGIKIKWPVGVDIKPELPGPWPPITIGWDKRLTYPVLKATAQCTTQTADICRTTTTLDIKTVGGTRTTSTRTQSTCDTIRGCRVNDDDWETTTTRSCTRLAKRGFATVDASPTPTVEPLTPLLQTRDEEDACVTDDIVIYPEEFRIMEKLEALLDSRIDPDDPNSQTWRDKSTVVGVGEQDDFVAFIYIPDVERYIWHDWDYDLDDYDMKYIRPHYEPVDVPEPAVVAREVKGSASPQSNRTLNARAPSSETDNMGHRWDHALMSVPPGLYLDDDYWNLKTPNDVNSGDVWITALDESRCQGQVIYMVEQDLSDHYEFDDALADGRIDQLDVAVPDDRYPGEGTAFGVAHGGAVASKIIGSSLGLCTKAELLLVPSAKRALLEQDILAPLVAILAEVTDSGPDHAKRAVVNLSRGYSPATANTHPDAHLDVFHELLRRLGELGVVVVAATHNDFQDPDTMGNVEGFPDRWANPNDPEYLPHLILASGVDKNGRLSLLNPDEDFLIMAPGYDISVAGVSSEEGIVQESGASLAAPLVASTIAYWRALPGLAWGLDDPQNVKTLVASMQRTILGRRDGRDFAVPAPRGGIRTTPAQWTWDRQWAPARVAFLWNGDVPGGNCLVNPGLPDCLDDWNFGARDPTQLKLTPAGPGCASGSGAVGKRQAGVGACPVVVQPPNGGSPGSGSGSGSGSGPAFPSFISFATGAPSPTCTSGCGTLCTGYFCRPNPTGTPPDQRDPNNAPPPVTTPTGGGSGSGTDPTPTLPPLTPVVCTPPEVITTGTNCIRNACAPTTLCVLPPATAAPSPDPSPSPSPAPRKQYLAVIREINPDFKPRSTFGNCDVDNDDDFYTIQDFGSSHQTKTYKNCEGHDAIEQLAYSPTRGKRAGQYTNGYRVVERSGGADVFNGKGKHQWCPFDSYFSLDICIIPLSCAHAWERVFKCEGVWLND